MLRLALLAAPLTASRLEADALVTDLWAGLLRTTVHYVDLIRLPLRESSLPEWMDSIRASQAIDLSGFDGVIATQSPGWFVDHPLLAVYPLTQSRNDQPMVQDGWDPELNRWTDADHSLIELAEHGGSYTFVEVLERYEMLLQNEYVPEHRHELSSHFSQRLLCALDRMALRRSHVNSIVAPSRHVAADLDFIADLVDCPVVAPPTLSIGDVDHREGGLVVLPEVVSRQNSWYESILTTLGSDPSVTLLHASDTQIWNNLRERFPSARIATYVSERQLQGYLHGAAWTLFLDRGKRFETRALHCLRGQGRVIACEDSGALAETLTAFDETRAVVVPPDSVSIKAALARFANSPLPLPLPERAMTSAQSWLSALIPATAPKPFIRARRRPRIVTALTYPVVPVRGGGQARIYHLFSAIARRAEVQIVTLAEPGAAPFDAVIGRQLRETRVPMSREHHAAEEQLRFETGILQITDIAFTELHSLTPDFGNALALATHQSDFWVSSHPFAVPAHQRIGKLPNVHDSHNVELDLKVQLMSQTPTAKRLLDRLRTVERDAVHDAEIVSACSQADAERLAHLYTPKAAIVVAPNGVDTREVDYIDWQTRQARKGEAGLSNTKTAFFMGSWHGPNVEAVDSILQWAGELQGQWQFLIAGSVIHAPRKRAVPPNVRFLGVIDEATKAAVMGFVDLALNPMMSGAGTNVKMLDYMAAGIPTLTTALGARGIDLVANQSAYVADLVDFPRALAQWRFDEASEIARSARQLAESTYDWRVIATRVLKRWEEAGLLLT
jgi:glycosyltransferase involved in cell wall biosynthesis